MIELKGGHRTSDPKLDRIPEFDEASREHPIAAVLPEGKIASKTWTLRRDLMGNQGREGACVEFGITHELGAQPVVVPRATLALIRREHRIYWPAQESDPWPGGEYPGATPRYGGTSLLSGIKVAQAMGFFDAYKWAFSIDEGIAGVVHTGPAVIAISLTEGLANARPDGLALDEGSVLGGHCLAWTGVQFGRRFSDGKRDVAVLPQSWGPDVGDHGRIYVPLADLERRLKDDGETAFFSGRHAAKLT
jgi:hypothetical protein